MTEKYQWNLTDIFKTKEDFENEILILQDTLEQIKSYQGKLKENSQNIYNCYKLYEKSLEHYEKIYGYGMLKFHLDMADSENIKLYKRCEGIGTEFEKTVSFITPEITEIDADTLLKYIDENTDLKRYERELREIIKNKAHILSKEEENILANYSEVFNSSENTYDILTNTEFKFGNIIDENRKEIEMTDSNYTVFLKSQNENIRKQAFDLMYKKYKEFLNTIGELYLTRVKQDTITSRLRKYSSSLEKAVENDDSNLKVYNSLIEAVNQNMKVNHEFIKLKKELLKKDEMHIYDVYVNPIEVTDDVALDLYKKSDLPWKSYIQILSYLAATNYKNTSYKILDEKINRNNAKEALEIYDTFLKRKTNPMPELYLEIKEKIKSLQNEKEG